MVRIGFFFQAEDGIRDLVRSRGLGDVYKRQPAWQVVLEGTPGALLRAHGTSANDVWIVGADADGQGPLVYHLSLIHI